MPECQNCFNDPCICQEEFNLIAQDLYGELGEQLEAIRWEDTRAADDAREEFLELINS